MRRRWRAGAIAPRSFTLPLPAAQECLVEEAERFVTGLPWIYQDPHLSYKWCEEVGVGRFAKCCMVRQRRSGRLLACKQIDKRSAGTDRARILREVEMLGTLGDHPNIARVEEIWEDANVIYIFMEACMGGELFDFILEQGYCTERDAAVVMRVVLQVLQHCHDCNILHRDIKPENFLLKDREARLEKQNIRAIDFGVSCFLKEGEVAQDLVGSSFYIAPEALTGEGCSYASDVWSAGVMLYTLLSGMPPFWGDTDEEAFFRVLHEPIDLWTDPWPLISEAAKDLVSRLLVRDLGARMTVAEALCHPWLHEHTAASAQPLNLLLGDRLRAFMRLTHLQRLLLHLAVLDLPRGKTGHLAHLFQSLDTDGDGCLSIRELRDGLADMGITFSSSELAALVDALDIDGSGVLSFRRFLAGAIDKRTIAASQKVLTEVRGGLVESGGSTVTIASLAAALAQCEVALPEEQLADVLQQGLRLPPGVMECDVTALQEELRKSAVEHAAPQRTSPVSPEAISQEAGPASTSEAALEAPGSESGVAGDAATAAGHRLVSGISLGMQEAAAAAAEAAESIGAAEAVQSTQAEPRMPEAPRRIKYPDTQATGGSPELASPFFLRARGDDEKAGGRKSAGPLRAAGASPERSSKSSADAMTWRPSDQVAAPAKPSGISPRSSVNMYGPSGSSPSGSHLSSESEFRSGGVVYWAGMMRDSSGELGSDPYEGCSDELFGEALAEEIQRSKVGHG